MPLYQLKVFLTEKKFLKKQNNSHTQDRFFFPTPHTVGILAPLTGIEPTPPALEGQSLNHWTAREIPGTSF